MFAICFTFACVSIWLSGAWWMDDRGASLGAAMFAALMLAIGWGFK